MRVIVPFALSSPWSLGAAKLALKQDGVAAEFFHMATDLDYYDLLSSLWKEKEGFIVIEHDIVVWPGAVQQLEDCTASEGWCTIPYYCSVGWINDGLGCTKFSKDFIVTHPEYLETPFPECCNHTKHYCGLDRLIAHRAEELNIQPHVHFPGVCNLNEKWT